MLEKARKGRGRFLSPLPGLSKQTSYRQDCRGWKEVVVGELMLKRSRTRRENGSAAPRPSSIWTI